MRPLRAEHYRRFTNLLAAANFWDMAATSPHTDDIADGIRRALRVEKNGQCHVVERKGSESEMYDLACDYLLGVCFPELGYPLDWRTPYMLCFVGFGPRMFKAISP